MIKMLLLLFFVTSPSALAQTAPVEGQKENPYINVGQAQIKKSLAAIAPIKFLGTPTLAKMYVRHQRELQDVLEKDLTVASYFAVQNSASFLESGDRGLRPHPIEPNGFLYEPWKSIGTEFLIKTGFNVVDDKFEFQTYVYNIQQREMIFGRSYNAPLKDLRSVAHKFCNDLLEHVIGKKMFFLTKLVTGRSTTAGNKEIFLMDWDGANVQQLTSHQTASVSPSWSRDGRYVTYSSFAMHKRRKMRNLILYIYDFRNQTRNIISGEWGLNSTAAFFPDNQNIVLRISPKGSGSDLYKMALNGSNKVALTNGPRGAMNVEPALSPDGTKLAFSSERSGKAMIYVMDLQTNAVKRLTFAGSYNSMPSWSPDGKKLTFMGDTNGHFDIFTIDADGRNLQRITTAYKQSGKGADNEDPTFSPDGRMILFRSNRTGHYQLFVITADGKNEYRITFDKHDYYQPKWSPFLK